MKQLTHMIKHCLEQMGQNCHSFKRNIFQRNDSTNEAGKKELIIIIFNNNEYHATINNTNEKH